MHSTPNNSATRTSLAMILDAYESPSHRLSHAVPLVSRFEVADRLRNATNKVAQLILPGSVHSTPNNSATRTSLAMILDAYELESPSHRLSHAVPLVSRFEVPWSGENTGPIEYRYSELLFMGASSQDAQGAARVTVGVKPRLRAGQDGSATASTYHRAGRSTAAGTPAWQQNSAAENHNRSCPNN